jgi:hypothetical protein
MDAMYRARHPSRDLGMIISTRQRIAGRGRYTYTSPRHRTSQKLSFFSVLTSQFRVQIRTRASIGRLPRVGHEEHQRIAQRGCGDNADVAPDKQLRRTLHQGNVAVQFTADAGGLCMARTRVGGAASRGQEAGPERRGCAGPP